MTFNEALNPYYKLTQDHEVIIKSLKEWEEDLFQAPHRMADLGCGNGHFLRDMLSQRPEWRGLGVEKRFKRSFKTAEKLDASQARVMQNQVEVFLDESPEAFWDEIWLQFPDPWPKVRHEKNRLLTSEFLDDVIRLLKPQGRFCFRSDCREYWEFLQMDNLRRGLFPISLAANTDMFKDLPSTLYQKKFMNRALPIYSVEFRKLK